MASCVVDNAFVYTAIYQNTPIIYPWGERTAQEIKQSVDSMQACLRSILYPEAHTNQLAMSTNSAPPYVLPFFAYPLPVDLIMDMLWGRLVLRVVVNLGKIVAALEEIGLDAQLPKDEKEYSHLFLPASIKMHLENGQTSQISLYLLPLGNRILYEFLSLKGFIEIVDGIAKSGREQAGELTKLQSESVDSC